MVYPSEYKYNLAGALVEQTYPSGRVVKNVLDANGDISMIQSKRNANFGFHNYAKHLAYTPSGVIKHLQLGNGLWESAVMNSRNQVLELKMGNSPTNGGLMHLTYEYGEFDTGGNVDVTKNAGNIVRQTISFNGLANPFVQSYKYDSLDRIIEAEEKVNGGQTWIQAFGYDRYGNRTSHSETVGAQAKVINEVTLPAVDANTNRFSNTTNYQYDAVGNLVGDVHGRQFVFNGDNKQTQVKDQYNATVGEYVYDGNAKRIKKITATEYVVFVYDGLGKLIGEYSTAGPPANPMVHYTATDQLGSPRVLTNERGEVISRRDFMPFGEEIAPDATYRTAAHKYGTGDTIRQKFTGYERDAETGLDFAEARYYYNNHGRFTAVDPLLASGKSANPQTFNRYAYTMNRPLIFTDPTGLSTCCEENIKAEIRKEINGKWIGEKTDMFISPADVERLVNVILPEAQNQFEMRKNAQLNLNAQANSGGVAPPSTVSESTEVPASTRTTTIGAQTGIKTGQSISKDGTEATVEGSMGLSGTRSTTVATAPGQTRTVSSPPGSPEQQNAAAEQNRGQATERLANQLDGTTVTTGVVVTKDNKFVSAGGLARIVNTAGTVRQIMDNVDRIAIDRANELNPVRRPEQD